MNELEESGCDTLYPTLDSFVLAQNGTVRQIAKDIALGMPILSASYQQKQDDVDAWQTQRSTYLDSLLTMSIDTNSTASQVQTVKDSMDHLTLLIEAQVALMAVEYTNALQSYRTSMTNATASGTHDTRFQTVHLRYLDFLLGEEDNWTAGDLTELQGIADLCPFDGNLSTFMARGILSSMSTTTYDDDVLCQSGGALKKSGNEEDLGLGQEIMGITVSLSPNPADQEVVLQWDQDLDGSTLYVLNGLGQSVVESDIGQGRTYALPTSGLQNGLYYVVIQDKGAILFSEKLIVSHE